MISKLVDWYLRRRGERRAGADDPMVIIQRVEVPAPPIFITKRVEVPVEVIKEVWKHPVDQELIESAGILSSALEYTTHGGEWKRHQVYAHLIKHYPDAKRRDIALAIEYALRESNGL